MDPAGPWPLYMGFVAPFFSSLAIVCTLNLVPRVLCSCVRYRWAWQALDGFSGLALFFVFLILLTEVVRITDSVNALFTLTLDQRRLVLTASINSF